MTGEFALIRRYFHPPTRHTLLAGGDDAALIVPQMAHELALSTDLLVGGQHFFPDMDPHRLGQKAAAVNLSDMAAMGATPRWVLLGLTLSSFQESWVAAFSQGFRKILDAHEVDWVGGDTTAGPLALAVTIIGEVPDGQALRRSGAHAGEDIWVSGTLGDAALGLDWRLGRCPDLAPAARDFALERFECPTPRVALGQALRPLASAAIDISDGLLADLGHLLTASGVGAQLELARIPTSAAQPSGPTDSDWQRRVLQGGEDYELCFTAPSSRRSQLEALGRAGTVVLTRIGRVTAAPEERFIQDEKGQSVAVSWRGYDHFAGAA
ncbi:thiamine-monophosphate kinase [Ferrovum myxofaciens]|uniref:Thiamine-monophosphate kinase n=2 Tax=root TaxID=1 RepID=A0A149VZ41_9PROT|nr:thiamine-phosphate kinase [Ferrovum myxofaciens]KXW58448.1 thiamine-monophosphate kinase [Ferrovum myxofaciens]